MGSAIYCVFLSVLDLPKYITSHLSGQELQEYRSWDVLLKLDKTLVRPHLEYCVQFWLPYYSKDFIKLERVPKIFTKTLHGHDGLSYKERLDRLGPFSLERRRLRSDLIEVYKIMRGTDQLDNQYLFPKIGESETRGYRFKVRGNRYKRVQRGNFFTEGGECLEQVARNGGRGGYNFVF